MTKLDRKRLDKIEREEWMLNHPGWWQERALNIVMIIISVLIGILIFYWCSVARVTEVEAAVFHKEADTILYVERLDTTLIQNPEFPPKAIEVDNSSHSDAEAEIEGSDMATDSNAEEERWESLGRWKTTGYCECRKCNGKNAGKTASGAPMTPGRTVAVGNLPFGTRLKINGKEYVVEDRGVHGNHVDILYRDHKSAWNHGVQYYEVFILR